MVNDGVWRAAMEGDGGAVRLVVADLVRSLPASMSRGYRDAALRSLAAWLRLALGNGSARRIALVISTAAKLVAARRTLTPAHPFHELSSDELQRLEREVSDILSWRVEMPGVRQLFSIVRDQA